MKTTTTPPLVAIYRRISQDRLEPGTDDLTLKVKSEAAVRRQQEDCLQKIEELARAGVIPAGYRVSDYKDNDVSASSGAYREAFERLLLDMENRRVTHVVAWHFDRLYRLPSDLERFVKAVQAGNVVVHTVHAGELDLSTPAGQMAALMFAGISRYEVQQKALRQRAESDALARSGMPRKGGRRPFGYEADGMTIRGDEATQIRDAAAELLKPDDDATKKSVTAILNEWNNHGIPPTRSETTGERRRWNHSSFQALMLRPRNAGWRQHRGAVVGKAAWPPIIDPDDYEKLRKILTDPTRRTTDEHPVRKHWLSFIMRCAKCGGTFRGSWTNSRGRRYPIYQCSDLSGCRVSIRYDVAESVVRRYIAHRITTPDPELLAATREDRAEVGSLRLRLGELAEDEREVERSSMSLAVKVRTLESIESDRQALLSELREVERRLTLAALVLDPLKAQHDWDTSRRTVGNMASFDALALASEEAMRRFDAMELHTRREIVRALCAVTVEPAVPGKSYKAGPNGEPCKSYERVWIQPLDPRTRQPIGEPIRGEAPAAMFDAAPEPEAKSA